MKYFKIFILIPFIILGLISCNNETETRQPTVIVEDSIAEASGVPLEDFSPALRNLMKTNEGVFRGTSFGMPMDRVKKLEDTTKIEEQTSDHLDFIFNYQELETAEVRYIFNTARQLSKVEINIYPKSKGSQDSLFTELRNYYNIKFGEGTPVGANALKWEDKKTDVHIMMEKKDTQKVHDINITISSLIKESAVILHQSLPDQQ